MRTLYYTHSDFLLHETGSDHPECADRLRAITHALDQPLFADLIRVSPPMGTEQQVRLIHSAEHVDRIRQAVPKDGLHHLDSDTVLSTDSEKAAFRAVGAVCDAVDQIMADKADRAFCAVRPPGHHAEPNSAMGFCLFNNVAIAAEYARQHYHLERVAIVDFDVHHGNGTQAAFYDQPKVLYVSSHEMPHYPGTGYPTEPDANHIVNVRLAPRETSTEFREKYQHSILPALHHFKPELLLISAGFDAHKNDRLSTIRLEEQDYRWVTQALVDIADRYCKSRIISVLEGGYDLKALAACVAVHLEILLK